MTDLDRALSLRRPRLLAQAARHLAADLPDPAPAGLGREIEAEAGHERDRRASAFGYDVRGHVIALARLIAAARRAQAAGPALRAVT